MTDIQEIAQAASRAYEDPSFAQEILDGKHDYPQVRDAILNDLGVADPAGSQGSDDDGEAAGGDGRASLRTAMRTGEMNVARLAERARHW